MQHALRPSVGILDFEQLRRRLRFQPEDGRIWLDDERMALFHLRSVAGLRRELIDSFGVDAARGLLNRMGYASGSQDAELALRTRHDQPFIDAFLSGPTLHMLEGMVSVEPVRVEIDVERGHFLGEFLWNGSLEVDTHLMYFGLSAEPVCWMELGYAAGYTTTFLGRPVLYREVECQAVGAERCRIVGKPLNAWSDPLDDLRYFQPEAFVNRGPQRARVADTPSLRLEKNASSATAAGGDAADDMVGMSSGFTAASHLVRRVADTKATVFFHGETGVGKELFARNLHRISKRASGPFVAVNCAAIPETLLEAELFGVEKGAYTGAVHSRPGRFERADGGTLFLDEVSTLTLPAQGKLLRALQEGEIERVGDVRSRRVDVRLVAAANDDLKTRVREGSFRSDLFYRLNVFPIKIPPLRERRDDLPLLMRHFLAKYSHLHGRNITGFTERAVRALLAYPYPGNIRELENMIERAIILSGDGSPLDVFLLFSEIGGGVDEQSLAEAPPASPDLEHLIDHAIGSRQLSLHGFEALVIEAAVQRSKGNLTHAARMVGLSRRQLAYRLKSAKRKTAARAGGDS